MRRAVPVLLILCACSSPAPAPDAGLDATITADAPTTPDGGACIAASLGAWSLDNFDDVSIRYRSNIAPTIDSQPWVLNFEFVRYGGEVYEGTFDLGQGIDSNFGTCARCVVAFAGASIEHAFFVDRGTLVVSSDPFSQRLHATLTGARLIEVTIGGDTLTSTPVPNGRCIDLPDVSVDESFPAMGWRCPPAQYNDGSTCNCNCGTYDPDCVDGNPVMGCPARSICPIGTCVETCDHDTMQRCMRGGVCGYGFDSEEICITSPADIDATARIGDVCADNATFCNIQDGFANGVCDQYSRGDDVCRPLCRTNEECNEAAFEICIPQFGLDAPGICAPRYPVAWTCGGGRYEDGTACDCLCGAEDPDCADTSRPINDCRAGERCIFTQVCVPEEDTCTTTGECLSPPVNDTCASAIPLTTGTTNGTTRAGTDDYSFIRDGSGCLTVEEDGPDVVYRVDLTSGQRLTVVGTPIESDLALYLIGPGDASRCDRTNTHCVLGREAAGFNEAETLTYTATASGTYYLVVDCFTSIRMGDFTLVTTID